MSDIQCPQCGYSALSIATRCPRCGLAFESRLWQSPVSGSRRRPIPVGLVIIMGMLVLLVVSVVQRERPERPVMPLTSPPASLFDSAALPLPPDTVVLPDDSILPADTAPAAAATDSTLDSATGSPPMPASAPPAFSGPTELLYATTWVNVRAGRSGTAPVVRILKPGDAVMVDSLARGWYRALEDGQALGYVDRSLVGPAPP